MRPESLQFRRFYKPPKTFDRSSWRNSTSLSRLPKMVHHSVAIAGKSMSRIEPPNILYAYEDRHIGMKDLGRSRLGLPCSDINTTSGTIQIEQHTRGLHKPFVIGERE
ncbi:hypothetical protein J6590_010466 [Homalodisca vitripennis]|nr:hypothetical protein J6590_010466 [Homalodisca vitripennis]